MAFGAGAFNRRPLREMKIWPRSWGASTGAACGTFATSTRDSPSHSFRSALRQKSSTASQNGTGPGVAAVMVRPRKSAGFVKRDRRSGSAVEIGDCLGKRFVLVFEIDSGRGKNAGGGQSLTDPFEKLAGPATGFRVGGGHGSPERVDGRRPEGIEFTGGRFPIAVNAAAQAVDNLLNLPAGEVSAWTAVAIWLPHTSAAASHVHARMAESPSRFNPLWRLRSS